MSFPLDKYKYVIYTDKETNKIYTIAISTYAGKTVKGIAVCEPEDAFDEEYGKRLAAARCEEKVAQRRLRNAEAKHNEARARLADSGDYALKMGNYYADSRVALAEAATNLEKILSEKNSTI